METHPLLRVMNRICDKAASCAEKGWGCVFHIFCVTLQAFVYICLD